MVVSGYSIDLYCDCDDCEDGRKKMLYSSCEPTQFGGDTYRDCARQARNSGWKISKDRMTCYAPNHRVKP